MCVSSCSATRRSDEAGGAATSDGASARAGAGMNDDGRGPPCTNHAAVAGPLEVSFGRERRVRFFSAAAGFGFGGAGGWGTAAGAGGRGTAFAGAAFAGAGFAGAGFTGVGRTGLVGEGAGLALGLGLVGGAGLAL